MEESTTSCASGYLFRFHPWWGKVLGWYHLLYRIYRNRSLLVLHPVRVNNVRIDSSGYYASFVATIQQPWMESSSRGTLFCCVRNHNQQPSIHPSSSELVKEEGVSILFFSLLFGRNSLRTFWAGKEWTRVWGVSARVVYLVLATIAKLLLFSTRRVLLAGMSGTSFR